MTAAVLTGCADREEAPREGSGRFAVPARDAYDVLPIRRAVELLAVAGVDLDAETIRCGEATSEVALTRVEHLLEFRGEDQAHLRRLLVSALGRSGGTAAGVVEEPNAMELAAAFYDPTTGTVVAVRDEKSERTTTDFDLTLSVHELVHLWRDRESGYIDERSAGKEPTDALEVHRCIVEGEAHFAATWLLLHHTDSRVLPSDRWTIDAALLRDFSRDGAGMPYVAGAQWMLERFRAGGWPQVWSGYDNPPASTEQLMHVEKRGDAPQVPREVAARRAEGLYTELAVDCIGELKLYEWCPRGFNLQRVDARIAAAGWDGDLASLVELPDGERVAFWRIVFDREADAEHIAEVMEMRGQGARRRRGAVVDWTSGDEALFDGEAFAAWSERTDHWRAQPADAASTAAVEARIIEEERAESWMSWDQGLVIPAVRLKVRGDEGWVAMPLDGWWVVGSEVSDNTYAIVSHSLEPLPADSSGMSSADLRERISALYAPDVAVGELRDREFGAFEGVELVARNPDGSGLRVFAFEAAGGAQFFDLRVWNEQRPPTDAEVDAAMDRFLAAVDTDTVLELEWNDEYRTLVERLPDLPMPKVLHRDER